MARRLIERFGGVLVDTAGDGLLAVTGSARALRAALLLERTELGRQLGDARLEPVVIALEGLAEADREAGR